MSVFRVKERRLAYQTVRTSSLHCCVPQCTNSSRYNKEISFHSFPVDAAIRAEWLSKIRRDRFTPTKNTRVCSSHFKETDVVVTGGGLKRLQKGAIPVLFTWNEFQLPTTRPSVWERCQRPESPTPDSDSASEMEIVAPDHDYCVVSETGVRATTADLVDANEALHQRIRELQLQVEGLQLRQRFGINRVMGSDDNVRFYTRFASRKYFMAFWALVENAVNNKMVRITSAKTASESSAISHSTKLPPIDELLLFLMYLSVGLPLRDLAERFSVHRSTASRIVSTWTHFLYTLLGSQRLWIPPEVVRAHLPPEFAAFPDTQVVLDCTEIFCQTRARPLHHCSQAAPPVR
ncbi:THAP domain-containing protein 2 [Merluccius polli]|uniref:THAP domain-containing protein 2 n=1 Tax=Merluccius polli TaxID=89951 RepID=A0AA47NAC0_MERPO|nr:THAP domain-containing protein 2 [Merluccius polli]